MDADGWVLLAYALLTLGGFCVLAPRDFQVQGSPLLTAAFGSAGALALLLGGRLLRDGGGGGKEPGQDAGDFSRDRPRDDYSGLGRGERTDVRGTAQPPRGAAPAAGAARAKAAPAAGPAQQPAAGAAPKAAARGARAPPPAPPESPRSEARRLVGSRLSPEQASRAAEKILLLQPYLDSKQAANLTMIWGFFDMPAPPASSFFDAQDPVVQSLKAKLNRQRLLLHPDKNGHPQAERTFKYLEQCHQRLVDAFVRREGQRSETVRQRTQREEEELRREEERKRQQEEERRVVQAQIQREEEEKWEQQRRAEEERLQREKADHDRLAAMLRDKEARSLAYGERIVLGRCTPRAAAAVPPALPSLFAATCSPKGPLCDDDCAFASLQPVGSLTVCLVAARELPVQSLLFATSAYAAVRVGGQRFETPKLPGCSPSWGSSFTFDVFRVDTALHVSVYREGLGWGLFQEELVGKVEIPFLDLEEWSGSTCTFGRPLEPAGDASVAGSFLELRCTLRWF